ncbi:MAG: hypothetical protein A2Y87_12410 [Bacteroidetes bacterium RBG_13_46_8]|nr:MAG: hypothetical protein A2Y87_12410 [Bacteroidetes bacterium RBG_13_46_8]
MKNFYISTKIINMKLSNEAKKLRKIIEKAIDDHKISKTEYEMIIHQVAEDGHLDSQEKALLRELQKMIADKIVKMVPDK